MSPGGAGLSAGRQKHLERRVLEDHRTHVAAVRDQPRLLAKSPLTGHQRGSHGRVDGNCRSPLADFLGADFA